MKTKTVAGDVIESDSVVRTIQFGRTVCPDDIEAAFTHAWQLLEQRHGVQSWYASVVGCERCDVAKEFVFAPNMFMTFTVMSATPPSCRHLRLDGHFTSIKVCGLWQVDRSDPDQVAQGYDCQSMLRQIHGEYVNALREFLTD